jgi:hypothetical protein
MSKRWVRIQGKYAVKVSTEGCQDIDDFIKAIKKELQISQPPQQISLSTADGTLKRAKLLSEISQNTEESPLLVSIDTPEIPVHSTTKQKQYKGMTVEASCRKYFDALASKLSSYYNFPWGKDGKSLFPTIGDVLFARKSGRWEYIYSIQEKSSVVADRFQAARKPSRIRLPKLDVTLPNLFERADWDKLGKMNKAINERIHNGAMPTTRDGKRFIVLSQRDSEDKDTVAFFKRIGVTAKMFVDEYDLLIKNEDFLSGSSGSEASISPTTGVKL